MHYRWILTVQELQSSSHIQKYGALDVVRESSVVFEARSEAHWKILHDECSYWLGMYSNELNNVRVSQLTLHMTFT